MSLDDDYRYALELDKQLNGPIDDIGPVLSAKREHNDDDDNVREDFSLGLSQNDVKQAREAEAIGSNFQQVPKSESERDDNLPQTTTSTITSNFANVNIHFHFYGNSGNVFMNSMGRAVNAMCQDMNSMGRNMNVLGLGMNSMSRDMMGRAMNSMRQDMNLVNRDMRLMDQDMNLIDREVNSTTNLSDSVRLPTPDNSPLVSDLSDTVTVNNVNSIFTSSQDTENQNIPSTADVQTDVLPQNSRNKVTEGTSTWDDIDEDIMVHNVQHPVIQIDDEDSSDEEPDLTPNATSNSSASTQRSIKQERLNGLGADEADIGRNGNTKKCARCQVRMPHEELLDHLIGCTGIKAKATVGRSGAIRKPRTPKKAKATTSKQRIDDADKRELLRKCGYDQSTIEKSLKESQKGKKSAGLIAGIINRKASDRRRARAATTTSNTPAGQNDGSTSEEHECPVCNTQVPARFINEHLDECLAMQQ